MFLKGNTVNRVESKSNHEILSKLFLTKGQVQVNRDTFQNRASLAVISHIGVSSAATRTFVLLSPSMRSNASRPRVFRSHDTAKVVKRERDQLIVDSWISRILTSRGYRSDSYVQVKSVQVFLNVRGVGFTVTVFP